MNKVCAGLTEGISAHQTRASHVRKARFSHMIKAVRLLTLASA